MSFSRLFSKFSQPSLARTGSTDERRNPSSYRRGDSPQRRRVTEPMPTTSRHWRKKTASTIDQSISSLPVSTLPLTPGSKDPTPEVGGLEKPIPMPLPTVPDIFIADLALVSDPGMTSSTSPAPDTLAEAWDMAKDGPKDSDMSRTLNAVGKPET